MVLNVTQKEMKTVINSLMLEQEINQTQFDSTLNKANKDKVEDIKAILLKINKQVYYED